MTKIDFAEAALQRLLELGMLSPYHKPANVWIGEVLDRELEIAQHGRISDEASPLDAA